MKNISFLIKPASGLCNMRCRYCFYQDEVASRTEQNLGIMPTGTAELLIREAYSLAEPGDRITFSFQGGEPTLAGLSYFRFFCSRVRELNPGSVQISYAIQTNGLAISEEWAAFLKKNRFLVGLSLDGTKAIHEALRPDASGSSTWKQVIQTLTLLQNHQVDVNLLCVISSLCAGQPGKVYQTMKKLNVRYFQFIPCLDPLEADRGSMPYSLTPRKYGQFLCTLFDLWYQDLKKGNYISIRQFDDYIHLAMGFPAGTCAASGSCGSYFVVEGDGSLYPCDFYCLDSWKLGKLGEHSLKELTQSDTVRHFLAEGEERPHECSSCRWQILCQGGCKRDWIRNQDGNHHYYCSSFQQFFAYAESRIREVAQMALHQA